jgi:hypothetical protein
VKKTVITKCALCNIGFKQVISEGISHPPKKYHNECRKEAMKMKFGRAKYYEDINLMQPKL